MTSSEHARSRRRSRIELLVEGFLLLGAVGLCWWLGSLATGAWLERAIQLDAQVPATDEVRSLAVRANLYFSAGILLLGTGRAVSVLRGRDPLPVPLLVPAMVFACLLGLVVHHATVELQYRTLEGASVAAVLVPSADKFAQGFALGALAAAAIMVVPFDLTALAIRLRVPIAVLMVGTFVALALFGTGPGASGVRINLGPLQPIEVVKLLFVVFLAVYLGARASKLRWQRRRILGLRWPRPELLLPAVIALLGIFAGLFLVGDLGPVLILALVFLGMFYLVTRATGWAVLSIAIVGSLLATVATWPGIVQVGRVTTRIQMWRDPWWNGHPYGDQLGQSLWAVAAGGWGGQGLGQAQTPLIPAGKTDLVLALLVEQIGAAGLVTYLLMLAVMVSSGLYVAARSRTPERVLIAGGASLLLLVQWAIIHAGTFGLLPLTGVVVPFLSSGRSSMMIFVAVVALVARLAEDGRPRAAWRELDELHGGVRGLAIVTVVAVLIGVASCFRVAVLDRDRLSATGIATRLADGTTINRQNPRLLSMVEELRRGVIEDRHGEPIAVTSIEEPPTRKYPMGSAMGTLLGTHPSRLLLPPWALERTFDHRLRGYGERTDGPGEVARPDLRPFAPLLALSARERQRRLEALDANIRARSVRLSLDGRLQREVADILQRGLASGRGLAAAAVVMDVGTGQVLARAQAPDYDPNDASWQDDMVAGDRAFLERFTGTYGRWPDKTGLRGVFQAGSIGKLYTALAAARSGWAVSGRGCDARADVEFSCTERDSQGPFFTRPGWPAPIHDHSSDPTHGRVAVDRALAVSCNVYFGQLALALGPEPFVALQEAGANIGYGSAHPFDPGPAGSRQLASTGFGQGALAMSVLQAARLVSAIGDGGRYRWCPATLELTASCPETSLIDDPVALTPVLAGMRRVMTGGTGRSLRSPPGVRVYGKTGTADVRGFEGEQPFGIAPAEPAAPHSWFVVLAEPSSTPGCQIEAPERIAVAVVVPRGGSGARSAGPLAMEIVAAARALGYLGGTVEGGGGD